LTDRPVVSTSFSDFKYVNAAGTDVTATLTPEQLAAILAVEVPLTVAQAAGNTNNGTATWTYSVADQAFDFLVAQNTTRVTSWKNAQGSVTFGRVIQMDASSQHLAQGTGRCVGIVDAFLH
jgi:hypothetical protein